MKRNMFRFGREGRPTRPLFFQPLVRARDGQSQTRPIAPWKMRPKHGQAPVPRPSAKRVGKPSTWERRDKKNYAKRNKPGVKQAEALKRREREGRAFDRAAAVAAGPRPPSQPPPWLHRARSSSSSAAWRPPVVAHRPLVAHRPPPVARVPPPPPPAVRPAWAKPVPPPPPIGQVGVATWALQQDLPAGSVPKPPPSDNSITARLTQTIADRIAERLLQ